jgi:uncharacterized membrane protein
METGARDVRLERIVGTTLRVGVRASTICLIAGLLLSLLVPQFSGGPTLMTVGLLILMSTPVARVVASVIEYAAERDWLFVVLTSLVLLEICAAVVAALVLRRHV